MKLSRLWHKGADYFETKLKIHKSKQYLPESFTKGLIAISVANDQELQQLLEIMEFCGVGNDYNFLLKSAAIRAYPQRQIAVYKIGNTYDWYYTRYLKAKQIIPFHKAVRYPKFDQYHEILNLLDE